MGPGSLSALFLLAVVFIEVQGCPDPQELSGRVEHCMEPLSKPIDLTVVGKLRSTTWAEACRTYNQSVKCVSDLENQCQSQAHELEVTRSTLTVMRNGFGQICEKKHIRDKYMKYAPCYETQAPKTTECLKQFSIRVNEINTGTDIDMESYDDNPLCGAFQEMVRCVNKALEDCGSDAASIVDRLMRAQVPQQIKALCQDSVADPTPSPNNHYEDPAGSANAVTCTASILLVVVSIFHL